MAKKKQKRIEFAQTKPADTYLKVALVFFALFFVFIALLKSQGLERL
ncbi:hypothetical protein [Magnetococcus sp. PR-3]